MPPATSNPGEAPELPVIALVVGAALFVGCVTALAGSMAGMRAVYLLAVPGMVAVGAVFALTRPEPLRFVFLALVAGLPFLGIVLPPGRLGYTVFDATTVVLMAGLLLHMAFARRGTVAPLFPARSLVVVWLLLLPCVALARYPGLAAETLLLMFAAYVVFWLTLDELRRPSGFERIAALLAMAVLVVAAGITIDHTFHMSLSFGGGNLNQLTIMPDGSVLWRAGGFFQDPQKAAGFLAALLAFMLVLLVRGRFRARWLRLLVTSAVLAGTAALFLTVSRAAILSFAFVSTVALVATNRWPGALKVTVFLAFALLVASMVTAPELWMAALPSSIAARFGDSHEELMIRIGIWLDTWDMFARHPFTGIGFGGFEQYLLDTRPGVTNYYGIGEAEGVPYIPTQPESGYFKILYEGGIVGSLAALVFIGATLARSVSTITSREAGINERTQVIAALAGMLAFAISFATLFNTADPRVLAMLLILLAVAWQPSLQRQDQARHSRDRQSTS